MILKWYPLHHSILSIYLMFLVKVHSCPTSLIYLYQTRLPRHLSLQIPKTERIDRPRFLGLYSYWKSKSSQLLPFCSTWDFCSHWADLRTPVLSFNRCAAPAKLPTWRCLPRRSPEGLRPEPRAREGGWTLHHGISKTTLRVVVFHRRQSLPLILHLISHFTTSD